MSLDPARLGFGHTPTVTRQSFPYVPGLPGLAGLTAPTHGPDQLTHSSAPGAVAVSTQFPHGDVLQQSIQLHASGTSSYGLAGGLYHPYYPYLHGAQLADMAAHQQVSNSMLGLYSQPVYHRIYDLQRDGLMVNSEQLAKQPFQTEIPKQEANPTAFSGPASPQHGYKKGDNVSVKVEKGSSEKKKGSAVINPSYKTEGHSQTRTGSDHHGRKKSQSTDGTVEGSGPIETGNKNQASQQAQHRENVEEHKFTSTLEHLVNTNEVMSENQCIPSKKEGSENNMEDLNMDDSKGTRHHQTGRRLNKSSAVELPDRPTKGQCVRAACYPHAKSDHPKLAKDKLTGIKSEKCINPDVKLKTLCKSRTSQDKVSKQSGVTKGCAKLEDQSSGVSVTSSAMLDKALDRSKIETVAKRFDWTRVPAGRKGEAPKSPSSFALTSRLGKDDHSNTGYPTSSEALLVSDSGRRVPVHGHVVRSGTLHDGQGYRNNHLSKSNDLVKSTQFEAGSKTEVPKIGNGVLINRAGRRKDGQMGSHRDVDMEGKTRGHQVCASGTISDDVQHSRPHMAVVNKTSPPLGALCYSQSSSAALTTSAGSTQTQQITASGNCTDVYRPGSARMAGLTQDGQGYVIKAEGHSHIRFSGGGNKHAVSVQGGLSQTCSVTATTSTSTAWPVKTTCSQQAVWQQGAPTTTPMLVPSGYMLPYPESVQGLSNHSVTTLAAQPSSEPMSNAPVVTPSTDDENNNRSERVSSNPTADTKPVVNNMECSMLNTSTAVNNSMKLSTQLVWSSHGHHSVAQSQIAVLSTGYTINTNSAGVGVAPTGDVERECMSGDHASVSSGGDMVQHEDTKPVLHHGCTTDSTAMQNLEVKGAIVTQTEETPFSQGTGIPVGIAVARQRQGKLNSSDGGCSKLDPDDRKVTPRPGMPHETAGGDAITEAPTIPGNMVGVSAVSSRRDIPAGKNCTSLGSNLIVTGGDTGRPGLGAIGNHDGSLRAVMQSPWLQAGQVANSGMLWTGSQTGSHSSLEQGHTAPVGVPLGFKVVQDPLSRQCFLVPEVTSDGGRGWLATLPNTQQLQLIAQHCAQNEQEREQNQQLQQYWEYMLNLQRCYTHTLQVTTATGQSTSQGSMLSTAATSMPCAVTAAITSPVKPDLSSTPSSMHSCNNHRQTHSQLSGPGLAVFPVGPLGQAAYPYVPTQQFPYIVDSHASQVPVPHTSTTTMVTPVTTAVMTISRGTSPIQVALPDSHVSEQADAAIQNCLSPDMETCRARLLQIEVKDTFVQTEVTNGYREQEESKVTTKIKNSFLCERCHVLCTEESNKDKSSGSEGEKTVHDVKAKIPVSSATNTGSEQAVCQTENRINPNKGTCEAVDLRTKVSCDGTQSKSLQVSHPGSTTQTKDQIVESIYRDLDPGSLTSADGLELLSLLAERKSLEWKEELKQKQISVKTAETVKPTVKSHCKRTCENKVAPESRIARVLSWKSDNSSDSTNGGLLGSPVPKPHPDSDTCIDPQELDVRMKMAEIQRKYREHQRRLARLQPKKQEKGKKEKNVSRRRPGRPPKKKVATSKQPSPQKSSSEEKSPVKAVKPPEPVETPEKKEVCEIKPVNPVKVDVIPAEATKKEVKVMESPPKEEKITPKVEVKTIPFKYESKGPLMLAKCSMPPPMVLSRKLKAALRKSAEAVKKKAKAEKRHDSKTKGDSKISVSKIKDKLKLKDSHKKKEGSSKEHSVLGSPENIDIKHEKQTSPVGVSERHSNETSPAKMNLSSLTKDTWQKTAVSKVTATETTDKPEATVSVLAKYGVDRFSTTTSIAAATSAALKSKDSKKRKKMLQENGYDLSDWQDYPGVKRRKPGRPRKLGDSPSRVTETIVSKKSGVSPLSSGSPVKPQPVVKQSPKIKPEPLDDLMFCRRSERIFLNNPAIVSPTPAKVSSDTKPKTLHKPAKATTSAQSLSQKLKKKYANKNLSRNTVLKNRSVSTPVPAKRIVKVEPERNESDVSEADDVPLSNLVDKPETTDGGPCKVTKENLKEGLRVLMYREGLFYEGKVKAIQPPDVYGVVIDGERGSRPHVYSREQLLQEIVLDVKPESMQDLPEGTRVCAYWSELFSCLYPGTIARASPNPYTDIPLVYVEFDDGDSGKIPLDHTRLLPQDFTVDDFEHSDRLESTGKKRRRTISGELSVENIERKPSISDTLTGYLLSPAKLELTKKRGPGRPPKHASSPREQRKSIDNSCLGAYIRNTNTERKKQDLSSTSFPSDQNMKKNVGKSVKGLTPDKSGRRASESSVRKSKKEMMSSSEDSDDDDDDDGVMLRRRAGSDEETSSDDENDDISQMFEGKGKLAAVRKRATAGFLTARQLWEWQGKSTKRPGMKGKAKKEFYKAVVRGKETIKVGECAVFLSNNRPNLPFVGRIESMWEGWGGNMVVKVKWFYHPEETKGVRKMNLTKGALFRSPHSDENDVQTISHRCEVLSYKQFLSYKAKKQQNDGKVDPYDPLADCKDIFYLAGSYDPGLGIVTMETGLG